MKIHQDHKDYVHDKYQKLDAQLEETYNKLKSMLRDLSIYNLQTLGVCIIQIFAGLYNIDLIFFFATGVLVYRLWHYVVTMKPAYEAYERDVWQRLLNENAAVERQVAHIISVEAEAILERMPWNDKSETTPR